MPITGLNWISIVEIQEKKLVDTAYFRVTSLKIFFWSLLAILLCIMEVLAGEESLAVAVGVCPRLQVTVDM